MKSYRPKRKEQHLRKKRFLRRKKTVAITLGLGIVITVSDGLYLKFKAKGDDDNNNQHTISFSDSEDLKKFIQSKTEEWFNRIDVVEYGQSIFEELEKKKSKGEKITEKNVKNFIIETLSNIGWNFDEENKEWYVDYIWYVEPSQEGIVFTEEYGEMI